MAETPKKTTRKRASATASTKATKKPSAARTKSATSAKKVESASKRKTSSPKKPLTPMLTEEHRRQMVAEAAYHRAEKSGFGGDPTEHWLAAEAEIMKQFAADTK